MRLLCWLACIAFGAVAVMNGRDGDAFLAASIVIVAMGPKK